MSEIITFKQNDTVNMIESLVETAADRLYKLNSLNRFQTTYRVHTESVAAHTFYVQTFVRLLHNIYQFDLHKALDLAYFHDIHESVIGDILQSAKNFSQDLSDIVDVVDVKAAETFDSIYSDTVSEYIKNYNSFCETSSPEIAIVKISDILSSILFLYFELRLGNSFCNKKYKEKINWLCDVINSSKSLKEKPNLYIIEGFDRIGKDYILNSIKTVPFFDESNFEIFSQFNNPPDYRDTDSFESWLKPFLLKQADELISLSGSDNKNIIMSRLFSSEAVYSELFNRNNCVDGIFYKIKNHFNIKQIILLYDSYDQYLKRCNLLQTDIEYSKEEFEKINNLYVNNKYSKCLNTSIYTCNGNFDDEMISNIINEILLG